MTIARYNLVKQYTTTVGSGDIALDGAAVTGFMTFTDAGVQDTEVVPYGIHDGANSEVGTATYSTLGSPPDSPPIISLINRTVEASTNSGNPISLSGNAIVFIGPRAGDFGTGADQALLLDSSGKIPASVMVATGLWSTGDAKITLKTTADAGWVMMNDGTIGDASSSATTRANADCQALFLLLWANVDDTGAPVVGGRGGSALGDWNGHKRITLTRQLGRSLAIAGSGAGLTARTLGRYDGNETHTQTEAEIGSHAHSINPHTHALTGAVSQATTGFLSLGEGATAVAADTGSFMSSTSGVNSGGTINAAGSGTPMNIMNPRSYWNIMIKL